MDLIGYIGSCISLALLELVKPVENITYIVWECFLMAYECQGR